MQVLHEMPELKLHQRSVRHLSGVGDVLAERLSKLGLFTIFDLLLHLPARYEDRSTFTPFTQLVPGSSCLIVGKIVQCWQPNNRGKQYLLRLQDERGYFLQVRFFQCPYPLQQRFTQAIGQSLRCYGPIRWVGRQLEMVHPEFHFLAVGEIAQAEAHLVPIYPTTEKLTQGMLRKVIARAIQWWQAQSFSDQFTVLLNEHIDASRFTSQACWLTFIEAVTMLHHPLAKTDHIAIMLPQHPARVRLAVEELVVQSLMCRLARQQLQHAHAPAVTDVTETLQKFQHCLPYQFTGAQKRVMQEISHDLLQSTPMYRLVQGDVGAGKTVVAGAAAMLMVAQKYQVALMAPTEILAQQHYIQFTQWFKDLWGDEKNVVFLTGGGGKAKQVLHEHLKEHRADMVIGTHALLQEKVQFNRLGLVIIDEQHRFGVAQRLALLEKGEQNGVLPHQLIMTATPIPRTLAMTLYAELDNSIIDERPSGRLPITTVAIAATRRAEVIERIRAVCHAKRQAYWVCVAIEDSPEQSLQSAKQMVMQLTQQLNGIRIGLMHGKLKPVEKQNLMSAFKAGEIDLLVATTVIEVGVDVANATLMIIENAERLGLAQLHQLRGRVGRGIQESFCVLLYTPPLDTVAHARLTALRESNDGFLLAEKDLQLRGPGEILGTRQSGQLQFRVVDLHEHAALIPCIPKLADQVIAKPTVWAELTQRWIADAETVTLASA